MFQHILLLMPKKNGTDAISLSLSFSFLFSVEERIITGFLKNVHIPIIFKGKFCFLEQIDFWREEQVNNLLKTKS